MALATDVISDQRLRDAIGLVGDEADDLISGFRDSAIDWIERYTGRCIIDRPEWTSGLRDFSVSPATGPDYILFSVSDIKNSGDVVINYAAATSTPRGKHDATPITIPISDNRVSLDQDYIAIYSSESETWRSVMRFDYPTPTITVDRGMLATDIPKTWGDAVALIVRALYDGSAYDSLSNMSTLQILMRPYFTGSYSRTAR